MDLGLNDKACIVTGATSGIGLATAERLRSEGARVLGVARSNADFAADITEPGAAERIVAECESRFGQVDALVNNAGTSAVMSLDELTEEEWELQWQLNVMGPMRLMRAAAPGMAERGWGRIVNVASSAGKRPSLRNPAYTVTKTAQLALSRVYADSYAGRGVLVNAVAPGPTATELWTGAEGIAAQQAKNAGTSREEELEAAGAKVPIGRLAEPEEIASVIAFLCSEQASNVAGSSWSVDGGIAPLFI
ncbi:MAG: 3-oxoacyl-[acyl-carrier protein] reductase [Thermoleophilaceae bacterium]|jgi:3-oxoacyl-[acyl-carrier protein] reductase|nr:3-oxoacyl-[acyl-carrier protein] reductase [Thermoleophilaceae bacterium]